MNIETDVEHCFPREIFETEARVPRLAYILEAHTATGYQAAADLLTRHDRDSDFATDACIYKQGIDPETGARYLEEIAFEVVSEQNEGLVTPTDEITSQP